MRTLGRIFFLFLSIVTGLWFVFSAFVVFASTKNPDNVAAALGAATVPLLLFIVCIWFYRGLAPSPPDKGSKPNSGISKVE